MMNDLIAITPFNRRPQHLANLPQPSGHNDRHRPLGYRSQATAARLGRFRNEYLVNSPQQSLDLLRQVLQVQINREIDELLSRYNRNFLQPAWKTIQTNLKNGPGGGAGGASNTLELDVKHIFCEILDQAKTMYQPEEPKEGNEEDALSMLVDNNSSTTTSSSSDHSPVFKVRGRPAKWKTTNLKSKSKLFKMKNKLNKTNHDGGGGVHGHKELVHDETKWDPARLSIKTLFVLGSKANKALGFGMARGRLYTKHANLFRYIGDQEDKEWLHRNQLMPPTGGKAYLLVRDDILELIESEEYRNTANTNIEDMGEGFTVPQTMINKMITAMEAARSTNNTPPTNRTKLSETTKQDHKTFHKSPSKQTTLATSDDHHNKSNTNQHQQELIANDLVLLDPNTSSTTTTTSRVASNNFATANYSRFSFPDHPQ